LGLVFALPKAQVTLFVPEKAPMGSVVSKVKALPFSSVPQALWKPQSLFWAKVVPPLGALNH
jgi:hypothetical protein